MDLYSIRKILEVLADIPPSHPLVVAIVSTLLFGTTALIYQTFENRRLRKELENLRRQLSSLETKLNNIDRKTESPPRLENNNNEANFSLTQLRTLFNQVVATYNIQYPLSDSKIDAQTSPRNEIVPTLSLPDSSLSAKRPHTPPTDPNNNNNVIPQTPVVPPISLHRKSKTIDKHIDYDTEVAIQEKLLRKSQSHLGSQSAPASTVNPPQSEDIKSILKTSNRNFQSPFKEPPRVIVDSPDSQMRTPINKNLQGVVQTPSQHIQWQSPIEKRVLVSPPFSPCTSPRMDSPLSPAPMSPGSDFVLSPPISPVPKDPPPGHSASSPIPIPSPRLTAETPETPSSFIQTKDKKSKQEKQKEFDLKNVLAKMGVGSRPTSPNTKKSATSLAASTPILKRSKRSKSLSEQDNTETFPRDIASILAPLLPPSPSGHNVPGPVSAPTTPLSKSTPALRVHRHDYISAETQSKSTATKHFFFEYYWNLFFYLEQRQERLSNLKQKLETEKVDGEVAVAALKNHFSEESNKLRKRRMRMKANDFQILAKIGRGGFGDVFLCRQRKSQEVFAMKRIKRAYIDAKNKTSHVQLERAILSDTQSPWLVKLYCSFQDHKYLYLVMEYVPGGDMRGLLSNVTRFSEADAAHYTAEMIVAVIELHNLGFIHRDLKPENFLITKEGHLKLGDFGLSKKGLQESTLKLNMATEDEDPMVQHKGKGKNKSMVGSPNYMAIEILKQSGYDFTIDFWSIGVILFELIVGIPPFDAETPPEIFENILNYKEVLQSCYDEISLEDLSQDARDLINGLICEPENRLGRGGLADFKNTPFLREFNWDNILDMQPPFVPQLSSEVDHRYFELSQSLDDVSASVYFDKDDLNFKNLKPLPNFTYVNLEPPLQANNDAPSPLQPAQTVVGSPVPIPSPRQPVKKLSF